MKKMTAWALLLALCVAMFAGCSNEPEQAEPVNGLDNAYAYVKTIYKNDEGTVTGKDYQVVGSVPANGQNYKVTWTVDVEADVVAIVEGEDGMVTIDVNEKSSAEVAYVLTASLTDGTTTKTLSWKHTLPAAMNVDGLTYHEIVEMAYALADQSATEDSFRLFGTVTKIDTAWNPDYGNITVTIAVAGKEDKPIQCYRLKGEGAENLKVGDAITVEGILKNYKGTYEFDAGCTLIGYGEHVDQRALLKAAFELADGAKMDFPAVVTGVITKIPSAWSEQYGNITVDMEFDGKTFECYRLKGEGAADLKVGDTITVAGIIKNYKGLVEFDTGCVLVPNDAYHSVKNALSAYKLQDGEKQEAAKTITGVISSVDSAWSDEYKNITVTIVVAGLENYPIQCYRLAGEGAKDLKVGDTITVTGNLKNYKGTYEFDAGCTLN